MERQKHVSKWAWAGLVGAIALYDYVAPHEETLSEQFDRWLDNPRSRVLAIGAVAMTAGHLLNLLPEEADPIHQLAERFRHG